MLSSISTKNETKSRRVSDAYMLDFKDKKNEVLRQCPDESKNVMGAVFGAAWRPLGNKEKKAYFEKYDFLNTPHSGYEANQMKPEKESGTNSQLAKTENSNSNTNLDAVMDGDKNECLSKRSSDEAYKPSEEEISQKKIKMEMMSESKDISPMSASTSRSLFTMSTSKNKIISSVSASANKNTSLISSSPNKSASQMSASTNKNIPQMPSTSNSQIASSKKRISQMSTSTNKPISEMSASTSTSSNKYTSSIEAIWKQKPKKKHRTNPFMIFCKGKRGGIGASYSKDKKMHVSTVLGQMWNNLPSDERDKYIEEAKRIDKLQNPDSGKDLSRRTKIFTKKKIRKAAGRPYKKEKDLIAAHIPNLRSMKDEEAETKPEVATDVKNSFDLKKDEKDNGDHVSSGSQAQASTDVPIGVRQQTNDMRPLHQFSSDCNQPTSRCWNTMHNLCTDPMSTDFSARPDGSLARPCAGAAGFGPPFFMPFPITNSLWMMYHQMQMFQQMCMQPFSQSYCCGSPYNNYYQNAYFNTYLSGRNLFLNNPYQLMNSAASSNFQNDDSARASTANERNLEEELVIVDEGNSDEHTENGTDHS